MSLGRFSPATRPFVRPTAQAAVAALLVCLSPRAEVHAQTAEAPADAAVFVGGPVAAGMETSAAAGAALMSWTAGPAGGLSVPAGPRIAAPPASVGAPTAADGPRFRVPSPGAVLPGPPADLTRAEVCPFCSIPRQELISRRDGFSVKPTQGTSGVEGYVLLIPHSHVPSTGDLSREDHAAFEREAARTAAAVGAAYAPPVLLAHGVTGQSIDHAHARVIPGIHFETLVAEAKKLLGDAAGAIREIDSKEAWAEKSAARNSAGAYLHTEDSQSPRAAIAPDPRHSMILRKAAAAGSGRPELADWEQVRRDPLLREREEASRRATLEGLRPANLFSTPLSSDQAGEKVSLNREPSKRAAKFIRRVLEKESGAGAAESASLPGYLTIADPEARVHLAVVLRAAARSRTGRSVLRRLEALSKARGNPVVVEIADIRANNGEYVYDWELVRLGRRLLKEEPEEAAVFLVHELLHVLQRGRGLPSDAAELEVEAWVVSLKTARELGLPFRRDSFLYSADRKFRGDLWRFIRWIAKEYDGNIPLLGSSLREYEAELSARLDKNRRRIRRLEKELDGKRAVLAHMEALKQPADAVAAYRADEVEAAERKVREERIDLQRNLRDATLLRDPAGRARYRAYARGVLEMIRRYHRNYPPAD